MQEKILLFKIRTRRDEKAFAKIYEQHASAVHRFLLTKLPAREDAEDALSTTFLRTWNYLTSSEVEKVSGLIFTIARGVVSEFYRTKRIETTSIEEDVASKDETSETLGDIALIKRALGETDEETRLALTLRFFEGKTISEVADHIQKSESATRMLIHRATKKLRAKFEKKL
ncbi:MAG: sigma-70 family RNA polymerase sigma factor [Patescibacteria group bacterium]|jgi:RNA polymerase sigma-70 factor (ECF subfamily)